MGEGSTAQIGVKLTCIARPQPHLRATARVRPYYTTVAWQARSCIVGAYPCGRPRLFDLTPIGRGFHSPSPLTCKIAKEPDSHRTSGSFLEISLRFAHPLDP